MTHMTKIYNACGAALLDLFLLNSILSKKVDTVLLAGLFFIFSAG